MEGKDTMKNPTLNAGSAIYRCGRKNRDPVKLTALLCLRESLIGERYEECGEFVAIAREFGALASEIKAIVENPRRHPQS